MNSELNKKQNQKVTVFAVILSVISIGLLVAGFLLVSSDKVVMLQSLSNLSSKLEVLLEDSSLFDKIATSKDIGARANINIVSEYANLDAGIVIDYLENKDDKKSKLDLDLSMSDQDLLGLEGVLANNNVYFSVDNITPNYYHTALEYVSAMSSLKGKDYEKLLSLLKETVTDYIDNDEIKKEKVEITYNGKDKKVNKLIYAITNKTIVDMITNYIDSLENDKELLKNIANYLGKTEEEVKAELNSFVETLTYEKVEVGCYYNVYYYGFNKIVKYELVDVNEKPIISYQVEDKEIIQFYNDDTVILNLEVKNNKTQYEFSGFIKDSEGTEMPFTGTKKDDTLTISVTQDGVEVKLAITYTKEEKENSYVYNNKFVLSAKAEGMEITMGTLDIDLEYYFGEKVDVDLSNSVDVATMTEADLAIIENNLMNHPIYQLLMSMTGDMEFSL